MTEPTPPRPRPRPTGGAAGAGLLLVSAIVLCAAIGAALGALLYGIAREGISLAGWDPRWFQALLGVLLLVALLANGIVRRRLKARPRS